MSTVKADNIANLAGSSRSMTDVVGATPRAWVNFNGTGTVAIRAAYNVSSITDNGTGDYTVNFTNALPDADYAIAGASSGATSGIAGNFNVGITEADRTSNGCRLNVYSTTNNPTDTLCVTAAFLR